MPPFTQWQCTASGWHSLQPQVLQSNLPPATNDLKHWPPSLLPIYHVVNGFVRNFHPGHFWGFCLASTCISWNIMNFMQFQAILLQFNAILVLVPWSVPVKNLSSQLTHWELTWKSQKSHPVRVMVSSFWGHLSSSQCTHEMSLQWACCELSVSLHLSQLANWYHCMMSDQMISCISHSKLMVWVWNSHK